MGAALRYGLLVLAVTRQPDCLEASEAPKLGTLLVYCGSCIVSTIDAHPESCGVVKSAEPERTRRSGAGLRRLTYVYATPPCWRITMPKLLGLSPRNTAYVTGLQGARQGSGSGLYNSWECSQRQQQHNPPHHGRVLSSAAQHTGSHAVASARQGRPPRAGSHAGSPQPVPARLRKRPCSHRGHHARAERATVQQRPRRGCPAPGHFEPPRSPQQRQHWGLRRGDH